MSDRELHDGERIDVLETRRTNRWVGLSGATLVAAVLAVLVRSPGLLLVAGLGVTLVAYASVASPPPITVALDRTFEPADPAVGESVTVELTIANRGDRTLPDLRVADGVPDALQVTAGDPRLVTALRPGAATTLEYEVAGGQARRAFAPAHVAVRDVAGLVERRARIAAGADEIAWPTLRPEPTLALLPPAFGAIGPLATEESGEGLAFHSVREYRAGDPLRRIDWRRNAKTGELATVEYRPERVATVVVIVDARRAAAVAPSPTARSAIDRSLTAASAVVEGLDAGGHAVGLAVLGPGECAIAPDRGTAHRERLRRTLADERIVKPWAAERSGPASATNDDGPHVGLQAGMEDARDDVRNDGRDADDATAATDGGGWDLDALLGRLDPDASVVLLSPLHDGESDRIVRRLAASVRALTVVSPDPTSASTAGERLADLERRERLVRLRAAGVTIIDWPTDASLEAVLAERRVGRGR